MTAQPEPRRAPAWCSEIVVAVVVLAVSTGIVVVRRLRDWLGL